MRSPAAAVVVVDRTGRAFYQLLGPFLGRRDVSRDLGEPPWDDDDKTWWVALDSGRVVGFAAVTDAGGHVRLGSAWVAPGHRGRGLYRRLLCARLAACPGREVRVTCRLALVPVFTGLGFVVDQQVGRFVRLSRWGITQPKSARSVAHSPGLAHAGIESPPDTETIMKPKLVTMTNQNPEFYTLLGPFLARREVHKAIGAPIYDEDNRTWIVAKHRGKVAGFLALVADKGMVAIRSCYLVPGHEALRPYLVKAAIEQSTPSPMTATVHEDHAARYTDLGFHVVGAKGRWLKLARPAGEPVRW